VVRRLAVVAILAGALGAAAQASAAAEHPGSLQWKLNHFGGHQIEGIDTGPRGRIFTAGMSVYNAPARQTWVHAYLPDGTRDTSFGDDGIVDFPGDPHWVVDALAQPDGGVLVAEKGGDFVYPPDTHLVRRIAPDGRPDTGFGNGGSIQPGLGGAGDLTDMELQGDGRFVLAGTRSAAVIVVARYLPDGSPDTTFGSGGVTEVRSADVTGAELAIQPDGGIVITTRGVTGYLIARLSPDGRVDDSFGLGGLAPVDYGGPPVGDSVFAYNAVPTIVTSDGRIRLAMRLSLAGERVSRMALIGLTKDGHSDPAFGRRGLAVGARPKPPGDGDFAGTSGGETAEEAVVDGHGGILVAGVVWSGEEFPSDVPAVIRRFAPNGSLDRSFGNRGALRIATPNAGYTAVDQKLALGGDDRLLVAHHVFDGKYGFYHFTTLRSFNAGYDRDDPAISLVTGCRAARVRVTDVSGMHRVVVRAGGRVIRRTDRKRFRVRLPAGARRMAVRATDLARNVSTERVRLPRC
jgi:uncharacterized delta-60 repeat protein